MQGEGVCFVGRRAELSLLAELAADSPVLPVVFVHGPGGIGKTALLHEAARRAAARGIAVQRVDGRDPPAAQEAAAAALAAARACSGPALVVVDAYEHIAALGALLREELDAHVGRVRLLLAGRQPPEPGWTAAGWADRLRVVALQPLAPDDCRVLLQRRGVRDREAAEPVVAWAGGLPLALGVAADALLAGRPLDLARLDADAALAEALVHRLAGDELDGADREVLAVAAIARAVDARLLASVLPGVDADRAEAWLRARSFAEPFGLRVTLHERMRKAARAALLAREPELERELRRRIADHVFDRMVLGEMWMTPDLTELLVHPTLRWGMTMAHGATHRYGPPAAGDADEIAEALGAAGSQWWEGVLRWFREAPEHVVVIRDAANTIVAAGVSVTPASAPAWSAEDRVLGPLLEHGLARYPDGEFLAVRDAFDLSARDSTPGSSPAIGVANLAVVVGSGLRILRAFYMALAQPTREQQEFVDLLDWAIVPELAIEDGERRAQWIVNHYGPGGIAGFTRDVVYRELALQPPPMQPAERSAAESVRDALRSFHDPRALAASPLARGAGAAERAASVRRLLTDAIEHTFGDTDDERLMRAIVEHAYVDPRGHAQAAEDLHISRPTYFRRLRTAVERVSDQVLDRRAR